MLQSKSLPVHAPSEREHVEYGSGHKQVAFPEVTFGGPIAKQIRVLHRSTRQRIMLRGLRLEDVVFWRGGRGGRMKNPVSTWPRKTEKNKNEGPFSPDK